MTPRDTILQVRECDAVTYVQKTPVTKSQAQSKLPRKVKRGQKTALEPGK